MHFALGTVNIPKTRALDSVLRTSLYTVGAEYSCYRVSSWVSDMPKSLEELRDGAKNRARNCRSLDPDADYLVGMEGWVYRESETIWLVGVVYIEDREGRWYFGYSTHLEVPDKIAHMLYDWSHRDLEQIIEELYGEKSIWDEEGSFWLFSDMTLPRSESFIQATRAALVPHFSSYYR